MRVSWDDYPIYYGKYKMFQTTNQILSISHQRYSQFWVDCPSCTRRRLLPLPVLGLWHSHLKMTVKKKGHGWPLSNPITGPNYVEISY